MQSVIAFETMRRAVVGTPSLLSHSASRTSFQPSKSMMTPSVFVGLTALHALVRAGRLILQERGERGTARD